MNFVNTLSHNLQTARKKTGLSQNDVANLLHITRQSVSQWENGHSCPDLQNLQLLSEIYQISVDNLIAAPTMTSNTAQQIQADSSFTIFNEKFLFSTLLLVLTFYLPFVGLILSLIIFVMFSHQENFPHFTLLIPIGGFGLSIFYTIIFILEITGLF